jgi:phosphonate transport system ATP-binding protein
VREEGLSMLCTLHQLDLARDYADRIIGMKAGRIEVDAAVADADRGLLDALYSGMTRVDAQPDGAAA